MHKSIVPRFASARQIARVAGVNPAVIQRLRAEGKITEAGMLESGSRLVAIFPLDASITAVALVRRPAADLPPVLATTA